MKHATLLTILLAATALTAQAATLTDTWSTAGGAWSPEKQPQFAKTGALNPDAGSAGKSKLINPDKQGIFESVFYTFFTAPTLTVATESVPEGLKTVTLELVISKEIEEGPTLKFNAEHTAVKPTSVTVGEGAEINGHEGKTRTFVWDVSELGKSEGYSIQFDLGNHAAFNKLQLIQTTAE